MISPVTRLCFCGLFCFVTAMIGCGTGQKGGEREPTFPILGIVEIDGQPEQQVKVLCHAVEGGKAPGSAYTDADGKFSIGTYEAADGVPAGRYNLTFTWGQINLMTGRYEGDKLNERYSDPEESEITVTVIGGEENELVRVSLTTK